MRLRQTVLFLLLVCVPLLLLAGVGVRLAGQERREAGRRFETLLLAQLGDVDQTIARLLEARRLHVTERLEAAADAPEALREWARTDALVAQPFVLTASGQIAHPSPNDQPAEREWAFLDRAGDVLMNRNFLRASDTRPQAGDRRPKSGGTADSSSTLAQRGSGEGHPGGDSPVGAPALPGTANPSPLVQFSAEQLAQAQRRPTNAKLEPTAYSLQRELSGLESPAGSPQPADWGWYGWYWGRTLHLLYWERTAGGFHGAELNAARFLADTIAELPESNPATPQPLLPGCVRLTDAVSGVLYQWGGASDPAPGERPTAEMALSPPLDSWRLAIFVAPAAAEAWGGGRRVLVTFGAAWGAVALALAGLAVVFYREQNRALREAAQRVSFVNQVSHELKTPLTNIRMYAEMLEDGMDSENVEDEKARRHVGVIVSESRRLSRLIANILTFSRGQRGRLALHPAAGVVDDVVREVIEHHRASMESRGIAIEFDPDAPAVVRLDADALAQILGNLLSNVEKYAAAGGFVRVATRQETKQDEGRKIKNEDYTILTVTDNGPGIPRRMRERIFRPFVRLSDRVTDGVTGSGIGLTIARELARLHGGDLTVVASEAGAVFEMRLATPAVRPEAGERRP